MTDWWNKNVETRIDDFKKWLEDDKALDTVHCREYIKNKQYKSMLDCGSGFCVNYHCFKEDNYDIKYTGVDSCNYLIELNKNDGIDVINTNLERPLPLEDNSYDIVYCRSVVEHLPHYAVFVNEMIRVAKKEVIIIFFITPTNNEGDWDNYWAEEDLYHNHYNLTKLENFINSNNKVKNMFWNRGFEDDGGQYNKSILHIILE